VGEKSQFQDVGLGFQFFVVGFLVSVLVNVHPFLQQQQQVASVKKGDGSSVSSSWVDPFVG
jgi:hypothetical protein